MMWWLASLAGALTIGVLFGLAQGIADRMVRELADVARENGRLQERQAIGAYLRLMSNECSDGYDLVLQGVADAVEDGTYRQEVES